MSTRSPKQRERDIREDRMRKRILKTALKLFAKLNYADVTMRRIASAIGYTPGNIYYYFKNKGAIFAELRQEGFRKLHDAQVSARGDADPKVRLPAHAHAIVDFALAHPEYYELMFLMNAPMPAPSKNDATFASAASFDLLIEDVAAAIAAGVLPPAPSPRRIALLFLSLLHGLVALMLRQRVTISAGRSQRETASETVDILFQYIGINAAQPASLGKKTRRRTAR